MLHAQINSEMFIKAQTSILSQYYLSTWSFSSLPVLGIHCSSRAVTNSKIHVTTSYINTTECKTQSGNILVYYKGTPILYCSLT